MNKIDFVFPYVDGNEAVWLDTYKEERRQKDLPLEVSKVRFRQWDNLKYLLRGIEKFLPWIGNVFMIVSNKEQVPDWINTDEVKIVLHSDIIPEEFLPTFNSTTIEMFLGNIKGLSERFIYSNDDMFVLKTMSEDDFFTNGIPKLSVKKDKGLDTMFKRVEWKCLKTIADYFEKELPDPEIEFIKFPHTIVPMSKETVRVVGKIFKPEIYASCSQFRKDKNFNQYLYTYYQIFSGNYLEGNRSYKYTSFKDREYILEKAREIADNIINQRYDSICINDVYEFENDLVFETVKQIINAAFEQILPEASKYELTIDDIYDKKYNIFKWLENMAVSFNFKDEKEIKMFVDGVISVIETIKSMRKTEDSSDDNSSDSSSSSDSSLDNNSSDSSSSDNNSNDNSQDNNSNDGSLDNTNTDPNG